MLNREWMAMHDPVLDPLRILLTGSVIDLIQVSLIRSGFYWSDPGFIDPIQILLMRRPSLHIQISENTTTFKMEEPQSCCNDRESYKVAIGCLLNSFQQTPENPCAIPLTCFNNLYVAFAWRNLNSVWFS